MLDNSNDEVDFYVISGKVLIITRLDVIINIQLNRCCGIVVPCKRKRINMLQTREL